MPTAEVLYITRWVHFVAGVIWIGLLYFLNLVNVPSMKVIDASARPHVVTTILPRVLAWFRHAAWVTVLAGFIMLFVNPEYWAGGHVLDTDKAKTIFMGMLLGSIMAFNVWAIIWPNQKRIIAATAAGEPPNPGWAKNALYASRANFTMSFPMLAYMGAAGHRPMDWTEIVVYGLISAAIAFVLLFYVHKAWIFAPKPA